MERKREPLTSITIGEYWTDMTSCIMSIVPTNWSFWRWSAVVYTVHSSATNHIDRLSNATSLSRNAFICHLHVHVRLYVRQQYCIRPPVRMRFVCLSFCPSVLPSVCFPECMDFIYVYLCHCVVAASLAASLGYQANESCLCKRPKLLHTIRRSRHKAAPVMTVLMHRKVAQPTIEEALHSRVNPCAAR